LALADSLLATSPLDGSGLAQRFVARYKANPPDVGVYTSRVLSCIEQGEALEQVSEEVFREYPDSAIWGLLTPRSVEDAVIQVTNLGDDADIAGSVVGALAGAAYGLSAIPQACRDRLQGKWPLSSARLWRNPDFIDLADRLVELEGIGLFPFFSIVANSSLFTRFTCVECIG
ncbi:MAG: ADP-ribosylglycohydrolase family protein, partial [Chloroflexi bacterium]|nr:ADP-ribosylglycohydrolase family protein [Chloroflexota bacterium]